MSARRPSRLRGYLMLEVGVGGAMAAAILAGLLVQLAGARVDNITRQRDLVAQQISVEVLNQVRARPFDDVTAPPAQARKVGGGSYDVVVRVAPQSRSVPMKSLQNFGPAVGGTTLDLEWKDVTVEVTFTTQKGTRRASTTTRVYRE